MSPIRYNDGDLNRHSCGCPDCTWEDNLYPLPEADGTTRIDKKRIGKDGEN